MGDMFMKKIITGVIIGAILSTGVGVFAQMVDISENTIQLKVNGNLSSAPNILYNGRTYVQLRSVSEMLGKDVLWDANTATASVNDKTTVDLPDAGSLPVTIDQKNIKVTLNKVEQDYDSLKIYVTYKNMTTESVMTGDSSTKVVFNGTQYAYDSEFNFGRYYEKSVDHAPFIIEPTVESKSIIFLKPISGVSNVNIVLYAGATSYKFNNVKVDIK
jgi:hypothetical protein